MFAATVMETWAVIYFPSPVPSSPFIIFLTVAETYMAGEVNISNLNNIMNVGSR